MEHLFGIKELSKEQILNTIKLALNIKQNYPNIQTFQNKKLINLFFEPSTRTRFSFELAAKNLKIDTINFSGDTSLVKGESIKDTVLTLDALNPDIIVVRAKPSLTPIYLYKNLKKYSIHSNKLPAIINAGDGFREHPTQALLDATTIYEKLNTLENLNILIIGDIKHSRVFRSNLYLFSKFNSKIDIVSPFSLTPSISSNYNIIHHPILTLDILKQKKYDILMFLRVQKERLGEENFFNPQDYHKIWGFNLQKLQELNYTPLIMHPGPVNRFVELDDEIVDKKSIILEQVNNGLWTRMAILTQILLNKIQDSKKQKRTTP